MTDLRSTIVSGQGRLVVKVGGPEQGMSWTERDEYLKQLDYEHDERKAEAAGSHRSRLLPVVVTHCVLL